MNVDKKYTYLSRSNYELADIVHRYVYLGLEYNKYSHDYGTGESYTQTEVHMVTKIEEMPGITVTELADLNNRTKGAISQIIGRLENKGLVRKEKDRSNGKMIRLYVTEKGLKLSKCHKQFDEEAAGAKFQDMVSLFGYDAVDKFFQILDFFINYDRRKVGEPGE